MALSLSRPDPSQPSSVSTAAFALSRRGYDQAEVRDFLRMVAAELARLQEREKSLEHELRQAQRSAPTQAIALDEEVVTRMLGEEAARILQTARDGAAAIKARAEEHCHRMVREVTDEAERLRTEVEMEVARRRQDSITDAEAEINMAKQQGREMVNEARAYREKVLGELARRREMARQQIEQLVHGRERLVQAFERARLAANDVLGELTPLIEPDEFVNLSPTTGPVPLMVPNSPPPPPRRQPDDTADVVSAAHDDERDSAEPVADVVAANDRPQVYDVDAESDIADEVVAAAPEVTDAPASVDVAVATEATVEVAAVETAQVEATEVEVAEAEVEAPAEIAHVADGDTVTSVEATVTTVDDEYVEVQHDDHDDRPIAPVVSIFGGATESPRSREPEVPLPPTAPAPPKHSVDDLFARLRASRPEAVAARVEAGGNEQTAATEPMVAEQVGVEPVEAPKAKPRTKVVTEKIAGAKVVEHVPVDEPAPAAVASAKSGRAKAVRAGHPSAPETAERPSVFERTAATDASGSEHRDVTGAVSATDDAPEASPFEQREEALAPVIAAASRKLKRVLADEQNDVLQLLRRKEPVRALDVLVPKADEHIAQVLGVVADDLHEAAMAGAASLGGGTQAARRKAIAAADATRVAREHLANVLLDPLRERLDREIANASGVNADIADAVRSIYRELKNHRIDAAIDDAVRQAFGSGALASVPAGTKVLWIVDPAGPPSPDCDDNALAGPVAAGDPFPTDHVCAPAHPGCRCMLVRAPR